MRGPFNITTEAMIDSVIELTQNTLWDENSRWGIALKINYLFIELVLNKIGGHKVEQQGHHLLLSVTDSRGICYSIDIFEGSESYDKLFNLYAVALEKKRLLEQERDLNSPIEKIVNLVIVNKKGKSDFFDQKKFIKSLEQDYYIVNRKSGWPNPQQVGPLEHSIGD